MSLDKQLLEILVCPKCKGDLEYREAESSLDVPRLIPSGIRSGTTSRSC